MCKRYMAAKRQHNLSWFPTRLSQSYQRDYYVGTNNIFLVDSTSGSVCDVGVLFDFSLTVKEATLIFISGRGSAISSANEGKSCLIYNLVKS